jgi:molybdopterin/thiamine biosynthesis adenylyltransferase/rhodanese-related sulfurtransferase
LLLSEIGEPGQEKLKNSKVLVIGAGGLGCPVLMYLAAAGVGKIGIVDFDRVEESNLQRQVLFDVSDVGKFKADLAAQKLLRQNPLIEIISIPEKLTVQNALEIFSGYDIIVDGTDNFSTRYLVNDACVLSGKTLVSGSVFRFQGQISVFNFGNGPTYRCVFPSPPSAGSSLSCSEVGVLGVLPGIIGSLMANEVIKMITGTGEVLSGRLLLVDSLSMNFQEVTIQRNEEAIKTIPTNKDAFLKMDYELFCGIKKNTTMFKEISAEELSQMISAKENIQILDVREPNEQPEAPALKELQIPFGQIESHIDKIDKAKKVIVFCRSGGRSRKAIELLSGKYGFQNLYNLKGGVMEWIKISG